MMKKILTLLIVVLQLNTVIFAQPQYLAAPSISFLKRTARSSRKISKKSWIEQEYPELAGKLMVTLSMEGNIPEFDPDYNKNAGLENTDAQDANTKGGLGAYYGDKLEGLADIGMNAIGCQPGYSKVIRDGREVRIDYAGLADKGVIKRVLTGNDAILVRAWKEDATVNNIKEDNPLIPVEVYSVNRGGTPLYLFVSPVHDFLYPDSKLHAFTQEIVFGKAVKEFLKRQNLIPYILHLNEAHTVVGAAQVDASEEIAEVFQSDSSFDKIAIIYTVHTNVLEGLRRYHNSHVNNDIERMMYFLGLPAGKALSYRSRFITSDGMVDFCKCAAEIATEINAVSEEHAYEVVKLFKQIYGKEYKVTGILNGSGRYWVNDEINDVINTGRTLTSKQLRRIHSKSKTKAYEEIKKRTGIQLDTEKITFWMVRRITEYKSQYPMLRHLAYLMVADRNKSFTKEELKNKIIDMCHEYRHGANVGELETVLNNLYAASGVDNEKGEKVIYGLGAQVVVGGPEYKMEWVEAFKRWAQMPELKGKFVYVPDSNSKLLRMQSMGADVCVNTPRSLDEACGTSNQRTGLNGGVNIAIKGAGFVESMTEYDEETGEGSGFFMGSYVKETPDGLERDLKAFYEDGPVDLFYKAAKAGRIFYDSPEKWEKLMHNSFAASHGKVTAAHMEKRYAPLYLKAYKKNCNTRNIYEMVLRDYHDPASNTSGLANAFKEIPHLAESGIKYITLIGLCSHTGRPYEIINPWDNDPRAGSIEELQRFISSAHEYGLKVLFDIMGNQHLSKKSYLLDQHPERFLYTNVSDGIYLHEENNTVVMRGRWIEHDLLMRRIALGRSIKEYIEKNGVPASGVINIAGRELRFRLARTDLRGKLNISAAHPGIIFDETQESPIFVVSATDLVSLQDAYPRVWEELAQPDLSNPDVISDMINLGIFRLNQGFDGFRHDAALAAFPERIRENWGFKPEINLTASFIADMRNHNPECFFLFEGFENQHELLKLADFEQTAAYDWESRSYFTDAVRNHSKIGDLLAYLEKMERHLRRDNTGKMLVSVGPEHDAYNFGDDWASLSYRDKFLMHFFYTLLPGYRLLFNGDIQGAVHDYRNDLNETRPVPDISKSDKKLLERGKKLFSLRARYPLLNNGGFHLLDFSERYSGRHIAIARSNHNEVVIGVLNLSERGEWQSLNLAPILMELLPPDERADSYVLKSNLRTDDVNREWMSDKVSEIKAHDLMAGGLNVHVGQKGCEIIRLQLKRVRSQPVASKESEIVPVKIESSL